MSAGPKFASPKRGATAIAVTVAACLAGPGVAEAAKLKGTVVAKDAARGTVVTTNAAGAVKTLRTTGVKRYRVGQRVVANATARPDGTFAAKGRVKRLRGTAGKARVRATVVKRAAGGYLVSAGSSTFSIPTRRGAAAAAAATPQVGDIVVATLRLRGNGPARAHLRTVGEAGMLEIEGLFLGAADGVLRLAVERRGEVAIALPDGQEIAAAPGDEVEALVTIAADGSFTLVALKGEDDDDEHDDHGIDFDAEDGEVEVEGLIDALSATSVTVTAGAGASVTCDVPAGTSLEGFAVGDDVELTCREVEGAFVLVALESDDHEVEVEEPENDDDGDGSDDDSGDDAGDDRLAEGDSGRR